MIESKKYERSDHVNGVWFVMDNEMSVCPHLADCVVLFGTIS